MKEYNLIAVGTGSVMEVVDAALRMHPDWRCAVIDKDAPGGICLTRGCIPSKILLYSAEVVRTIQRASTFGIDVDLKRVRFEAVMERMHAIIDADIQSIRQGLSSSPQIDYYPDTVQFTAPYQMQVGRETIAAPMILLGLGSEAVIPNTIGLAAAGYLTSDTILGLKRLPASVVILGGGYIAAEYGQFLSAMGSQVTIVGRNPRFLPGEEPEISAVVARSLGRRVRIFTNSEVTRVDRVLGGKKRITLLDRSTRKPSALVAEEILVAAGRGPTGARLRPQRGGVQLDDKGWVRSDEYLETTQKNVWALGDATGRFPFKHKANYDARVVYQNALKGGRVAVDYHAVPHAVFTDPEVAAVGLGQAEATAQHGEEGIRIGFYRYRDTAKGQAIGEEEGFVKLIVEAKEHAILGAHIVGPQASILVQEIVTQMYASGRSVDPVWNGMHIHPALSEVVERAAGNLLTVPLYTHELSHGNPAT